MSFNTLGIVIPLKAKSVSADWDSVCNALEMTITSVANQSSQAYSCIVVGHDKPAFFKAEKYSSSHNIRFECFDELLPPVKGKYRGEELQLKYEIDRCSKLAKGMLTLHSNNVTHWFALDADDLIHKNFVEYVKNNPPQDPIIFDNGYFYYSNIRLLNRTSSFSSFCGSSCVIPRHMSIVPPEINTTSYKKIFFGMYSHHTLKEALKRLKVDYRVPNERLVMYIRNHGENISLQAKRLGVVEKNIRRLRKFASMIKNYSTLSADIRHNFNIK